MPQYLANVGAFCVDGIGGYNSRLGSTIKLNVLANRIVLVGFEIFTYKCVELVQFARVTTKFKLDYMNLVEFEVLFEYVMV